MGPRERSKFVWFCLSQDTSTSLFDVVVLDGAGVSLQSMRLGLLGNRMCYIVVRSYHSRNEENQLAVRMSPQLTVPVGLSKMPTPPRSRVL